MIKTIQLQKKTVQSVLIAILIAATLLRFYQLNSGLWLDEIITYVKYARLPFLSIVTTFDSENQHFLYSLLAHLSFIIFGESNWALRLPAVLFGVGSIWAIYLLGREVSNDIEALLASALLTFSYHHVWFSQNARGYTGLLFWAIISSWLFIRGIRENKTKIWILYGISASLGVYTHLTMAFTILAQLIFYLLYVIFRKRDFHLANWKGLWIGFGMGGLLVFLLFIPVFSQILSTVGGSEVSVVSSWKSPLWTALQILNGLEISFSGVIFAVAALVLFGTGLVSYLRTTPIIVGLLIIPSLVGGAIVVAEGHHLWPRFFFFEIGFGALIIVRGVILTGNLITSLWVKFIKKEYASSISTGQTYLGIGLCLGMILVSAVSVPFAYGPKQDYQGAYDYIENNLQSGDAVATVDLAAYVYQNLYHANWVNVTSLDSLNQIRQESKRTWIIYTFPTVLESVYPDIMQSIQKDFTLEKKFSSTVGDGEIFIYRSEGSATNQGGN